MKRINLIPGASPGTRTKGGKRKSQAVTAVLVLVGIFVLWQLTALVRTRTLIMARKNQIKDLQVKLTQNTYAMEQLKGERARVNAVRQQAVKRLALLKESRQHGKVWSDTLIHLSELVPEAVWLSGMALENPAIRISGFSVDNGHISDFMAALDASEDFYSTGFSYIQKNSDEENPLVTFEITTRLMSEIKP